MSGFLADVLAFGAHPDDVELTVGGTLLLARDRGLRAIICHLTQGEMGTRGTAETRRAEAAEAAQALGAASVEMLDLGDGRVSVTDESKDAVIRVIRAHRPRIVLAPFWRDLHPDHEAAGELVKKSAFLAGLARWDTSQAPWRPERILHYMSHTPFDPDIVVDVSDVLAEKKAAAECYRSQFWNPESTERPTYISGTDFWTWWEGRASYFGNMIGVRYGEPYCADGPIPTRNPFDLFTGFGKYRNA